MRQSINYSIDKISRKALYDMDTKNLETPEETKNVDTRTIKSM
eukprot:CAMPEP_0176394018 /NCGR_PEP_ID=MMETSP0126-20121128/42225_1 /TAXON_ID=141414 ORGANISM="Strombidinopsis acuminatum, Strain SPMC142" /NCGR_SAMPLE_ID=MMETSP0126 /ASSEMBLY_ACC=CAM_ASM_000229 /LENGTH=42 /DNA_ID= /DNA_START= /DNA_END= /DNA_ORIENTATION=